MTAMRPSARRRVWRGIALGAMLAVPGCTSQQAAPFGKALFGSVVVLLVAIPIVFVRAWRRRKGR